MHRRLQMLQRLHTLVNTGFPPNKHFQTFNRLNVCKFLNVPNKRFKRFLGLANVERQEFCKRFVETFVANKRLQNGDL